MSILLQWLIKNINLLEKQSFNLTSNEYSCIMKKKFFVFENDIKPNTGISEPI